MVGVRSLEHESHDATIRMAVHLQNAKPPSEGILIWRRPGILSRCCPTCDARTTQCAMHIQHTLHTQSHTHSNNAGFMLAATIVRRKSILHTFQRATLAAALVPRVFAYFVCKIVIFDFNIWHCRRRRRARVSKRIVELPFRLQHTPPHALNCTAHAAFEQYIICLCGEAAHAIVVHRTRARVAWQNIGLNDARSLLPERRTASDTAPCGGDVSCHPSVCACGEIAHQSTGGEPPQPETL